MPDRIYLPFDRNQYRRRDRLWAHWYAFCDTVGAAGLGLLIALSGIIRIVANPDPLDSDHDGRPGPPWGIPGWEKWLNPAPSIAAIPQWQGIAVGLSLMIGGSLWIVSTLVSFKYIEDFWKTQRAGLLLLILGWAAYVMCAVDQRPEWVVPWWLGAVNCTAYIGGFYLTLVHQWRVKGTPSWVARLSNITAPIVRVISPVVDFPFELIERHLGSRPDTDCTQRGRTPTPADSPPGGSGD